MYDILMELMEPRLVLREEAKKEEWLKEGVERGLEKGLEKGMQKGLQTGLQKGIQEGLRKTIDTLREFGHNDSEIKEAIIKKYNLSKEEAETYF